MRRFLALFLLFAAGAGCTSLGDESPFPHRDAPSLDAAPAGDAEPDAEETTDAN